MWEWIRIFYSVLRMHKTVRMKYACKVFICHRVYKLIICHFTLFALLWHLLFNYTFSFRNEELNQWNTKVKINLRHPVQCEGECESRLCWSVQAAITSCRQCLKSKQYRNQQHIKLFKLILFKHCKERSFDMSKKKLAFLLMSEKQNLL
jgi:hypothetical protein